MEENHNLCCVGRKNRLLQWLVFFRQFNAIGPLFVHYALLPYVISTSFSTHPKLLTEPFQSRMVPLSTFFDTMRLSPFFRHWRQVQISLFSEFFYCSKGSPINFLILCNRMDVQKIPKGPPFTFFGTMRLTGDFKKNFERKSVKFFSSIFSFLRAFVVSSCRKSGFASSIEH